VTSSQGRAPIDVHWFEDEVTGVESLGDWILLLPATSFIILLGLLLYGAAATGIYYTRLLESEDFYLAEKIRFDADRKHFVPSTGAKPRSGGEAAA
jgi:hypothetical protein